MVDFSKLLSVSTDEIKKPEPLPQGTYLCQVKAHEYGETKSDKKTPFVLYTLIPLEPKEDVDQDELMTALQGKQIGEKQLRYTFYLSKDAQYRCLDFLKKCGVDTAGLSLGQCIPEATGKVILVSVDKKPSSKPGDDTIYNEITGCASAEED